MFIQCSSCNSKYLVNSADLKPDGRMVECSNCAHQWYQNTNFEEDLISLSVPSSEDNQKKEQISNNLDEVKKNDIKNLRSTFVKEKKVSVLNSNENILFSCFINFWYNYLILILLFRGSQHSNTEPSPQTVRTDQLSLTIHPSPNLTHSKPCRTK